MAEREWFYSRGDTRQGPVPESTLLDLMGQGVVTGATLVWTQGMSQWQRADQVPGLAPSGASEPPAVSTADDSDAPGFRPTCVTVFGILNIVFGAMALLCSPFGLITMKMPGMEAFGGTFKTWLIVSTVVGMIAAGFQVALGIGLLKLKPWARAGNVIYGSFAILWGLAGIAVTMTIMIPAMQKSMGADQAGAVGGMVGGMIGGVAGLIYPVLLLIFMNRQDVKDAFAPRS